MSEVEELHGNEIVPSDSDVPSTSSSVKSGDITLVAEFDELMEYARHRNYSEITNKFLCFVELAKTMNNGFNETQQECQRLQKELDKRNEGISDLECKLNYVRKGIDEERKKTHKLFENKNKLEQEISKTINTLIKSDHISVAYKVKEELGHINDTDGNEFKVKPNRSRHTGSLLSDLSCSLSEDDLDTSSFCFGKTWKKDKSVIELEKPISKKRLSPAGDSIIKTINATDVIRATTTITVTRDGPVATSSIIETIPMESTTNIQSPMKQKFPENHPNAQVCPSASNLYQFGHKKDIYNVNIHSFQSKITVVPENCDVCKKRIGFRKNAYMCKNCRSWCHFECRHKLPLPCIPYSNTLSKGNKIALGDYTPPVGSMIPTLLLHCIKEIELRGLQEAGIYEGKVSEKEIKTLKEKFLKRKNPPCLTYKNIHVVCGAVKDFLFSLNEPLITYSHWSDFAKLVENNKTDPHSSLYQVISELPKPNQDTLACVILHLKRVKETAGPKISFENVQELFGLAIVGHSSPNPNTSTLVTDIKIQHMIMEALMNLPNDYWETFVNSNKTEKSLNPLQQTPSTDSLLAASTMGIFSPSDVL